MDNLQRNLYSKHVLRFNNNKKFKILMLSDIQETLDYDKRTLDAINKTIEFVNPDLVILGGDNCNGEVIKTKQELKAYLDIFTTPMEKRKIPWAHVFGNHDHDINIDSIEETMLYEKYEYCVSKHTEKIYGTTNFVLPIKSSNNDEIAFNVWGLDTNNLIKDSDLKIDVNITEFNKPYISGKWDILHFEQLMWYWNSSIEIEQYAKKKINGIMFMHIAPWEFQYIVENPERTKAKGSMIEKMNIGMFNSGIFSTVLQRKDIRCIACGHTHNNSFDGEFCGIKMCFDACAGYSPYGTDELRGGRVFELEEGSNEIKTYMVHYKDIK